MPLAYGGPCPANAKPASSAPPAFTKPRRERDAPNTLVERRFAPMRSCVAPFRHGCRSPLHGLDDCGIASATAEMRRRAGRCECLFDLSDGRRGDTLEQFGGFDHHAVLAESAQRRLLLDPRVLQRVKSFRRVSFGKSFLFGPARRKTFQRGDFLAGYRSQRR